MTLERKADGAKARLTSKKSELTQHVEVLVKEVYDGGAVAITQREILSIAIMQVELGGAQVRKRYSPKDLLSPATC